MRLGQEKTYKYIKSSNVKFSKIGESRGKIYKSMKVVKVKYVKSRCGKLSDFSRRFYDIIE